MPIERIFGRAELVPARQMMLDLADDFGDVSTRGNVSYHYVNETGEPDEFAAEAWRSGHTLDGRPIRDELASALDTWSRSLNSPSIAQGSLFFRNRYTMTTNVFDQMLQCTDAVEYDEVLGAVCDATEGLAFQRVTFEMVDQDQEDVWNQVAEDLDVAGHLRAMWRELFKVSQFYVGMEWGQRIYKVRTKNIPIASLDDTDPGLINNTPPDAVDLHPSGVPNPGPKKRARRKQFVIEVPTALTILDPTKVLPVGQLMFGKERFAYIATLPEHEAFMNVFEGKGNDPTVLRMFDGPYKPTAQEEGLLTDQHKGQANKAYLWLFKQEACFRHTLSRAQYERFASIRLKSALPTLDLKAHLRASDRATLIGSTNFIIVLKRGTDKFPARAGEVEQLREQARVVARMPILVGDHRLEVDIVAPKTDFTLDNDRYNLLDERLIMRALSTFRFGGRPAGASDSAASLDEQIARGIEARRSDLARVLENKIVKLTMAKNEAVLTEPPELAFHPKRVVISLDADIMKLVLQLRDRGDISRETELEEFNYDQEVEYVRRKREVGVDNTFKSSVPFSSPQTNPFTVGGAGGRPVGGGGDGSTTPPPGAAAPKTPQV